MHLKSNVLHCYVFLLVRHCGGGDHYFLVYISCNKSGATLFKVVLYTCNLLHVCELELCRLDVKGSLLWWKSLSQCTIIIHVCNYDCAGWVMLVSCEEYVSGAHVSFVHSKSIIYLHRCC